MLIYGAIIAGVLQPLLEQLLPCFSFQVNIDGPYGNGNRDRSNGLLRPGRAALVLIN